METQTCIKNNTKYDIHLKNINKINSCLIIVVVHITHTQKKNSKRITHSFYAQVI